MWNKQHQELKLTELWPELLAFTHKLTALYIYMVKKLRMLWNINPERIWSLCFVSFLWIHRSKINRVCVRKESTLSFCHHLFTLLNRFDSCFCETHVYKNLRAAVFCLKGIYNDISFIKTPWKEDLTALTEKWSNINDLL